MFFKKRGVIRFSGEIDLNTGETRVKRISDPWSDWGYCLEICGMMAQQVRTEKGWDFETTANYAKDYILKCLNDYKNK